MPSKRIQTLASFISESDKVLDVGCDHCYLGIYLIETKKLSTLLASDVHEKVLEKAKENVLNAGLEKQIQLFLTDGLQNITKDYDTVVLAGMGTHTILKILKFNNEKIKKLIVQSNNELPLLRMELFKRGFYLEDEKVIFENKHYYVIGKYRRVFRKLTRVEKQFGIYHSENKFYYHYLNSKLNTVYTRIPWYQIKMKKKYWSQKRLLKKYLKKESW